MKAQLASATSLLALLALHGGQGVATYGSLASSAVTAATALTAVTAAMAVSSPAVAGPVTFTARSGLVTASGGGTLTIYDLVGGGASAFTVTASGTNNNSGSRSIVAANPTGGTSAVSLTGAATTGNAAANTTISSVTNTITLTATQTGSVTKNQVYTYNNNTNATLTIVGSGVAPLLSLTASNTSTATNAGSGASAGSVGNILVGKSASVTLLVSNSGRGNLSGTTTDSSGIISNLRGSFGTPTPSSSVFTGGATSVTVADLSTQSVVYTFAPTSRGSVTTSAVGTFFNGANAQNGASTVTTSLVGIGVAPVLSINNTADANYVLVGNTNTVAVTTTNTGDGNTSGLAPSISNLLGSVGSLSGSFTGSGAAISLGDSTSATTSYTFTPTARGAATATVTSVFTNGNATNQGSTVTTTLVGTGVAPVLNQPSSASAGYVLLGNSVSFNASINNTGDGNLAGKTTNAGGETISNLRGSLSSVGSNGFTGSAASVSLGDTSAASYSYVYTPTARGGQTATVTSAFVNGSATNGGTTTSISLVGTGVAPVLNLTSSASAGYVLVGQSKSVTALVTNTGDGNLSGTKTNAGGETISNLRGSLSNVASNGFSGSGTSVTLGDGASTTSTYVYTPTARGAATANVTSTFVNGSATNGAGTASVGLIGTGVAPVNAVSSASTQRVRIGTSATATVSITNIGDGNQSGLGTISNLLGTYTNALGAGFTAATPTAISLTDSGAQTIGFTYNATSRTTATATAAISFSNGKSDGTNGSQTVTQTVSATGVGPTYASSFAGAANTPVANKGPGSTLNFGTVDVGYWQSFYLTLANVTTDNNGGNSALTDLTIESFNFTGANAANFKIASGTGIINKGSSILVPIQVFSTTNTALVSTLTILTDQSAALGGIGDTFTYQLTAVAAPEPATLAVVGAGLAGLAFARRKRRQPVDA